MTDRDEAIEAAERLIRDERQRQISAEGWTAEHDDQHDDGSLLHAAVFYYRHAIGDHIAMRDDGAPLGWPWDKEWWKPKEPVRNLVRAGALCMAERDRLWRIEMKYASAATKRMARSYNWWPVHVRQKYNVIVEKLAASLHRTEPQTAPTCICPRCSATIVGEMNGPEDEPVVTDAERHALAENIEKYCKAIDEAGEKGWRGAVMGDRVELGRLTHENRNLIISSLRAGGWREDMPPVSVGCEREFIVAVYRASSGKAYTFAASYLNAYPLQYEHECPKWKEGVGCSGEGCDDGCPTTGWFEQTGDDDYSSLYNRLELREGDVFLGWSEIPKWSWPLPSAPHTDKEG